jgi:hypothetical protein
MSVRGRRHRNLKSNFISFLQAQFHGLTMHLKATPLSYGSSALLSTVRVPKATWAGVHPTHRSLSRWQLTFVAARLPRGSQARRAMRIHSHHDTLGLFRPERDYRIEQSSAEDHSQLIRCAYGISLYQPREGSLGGRRMHQPDGRG